jgi:archaeosine-15-forming tRNA-guanine transglycosylase
MSDIDKDKLIEWIGKNSWTGDSESNAQDEILVIDADDLMLAINNGELDKPESEET